MTPFFFFPIKQQLRGRGSRAVLKWFKDGVLAHDASYDVAIQLEGTEAGIYCLSYQYLILLSFFPSKMKWCCKMLSYVLNFWT